ncbi:hypothetical protein [Paenibacillus abyssi]|uniref:Uncharacterized protein n=1 Tax=Paenibacillus abyssi TaxID=1340531 RepID=A0A917D4G2_9BACL|nr:hypothetical protein [Paenibacillus abyssi]GGG09712.1 hypothetical protein GCM10010916_28240 [Paenibacillus abyssi]
MSFLGFMFFSTIEGIAVYALSLYIFRLDFKRFLWQALLMITLMNVQSFVLRSELSLAYLSPVISLLFTILFFMTIARVPLIWSMIMGVLGYAIYATLQALISFLSFGYLSIEIVQTDPLKGYILQSVSSLIAFLSAWKFYSLGYGFTFEFEKLRFRSEQIIVVFLIAVFIIALGVVMYFKELYVILATFLVSMSIFLFYSIRKETSIK